MRLGVSFGGFPETPLQDIASLLAAVGVDYVEIAVGGLAHTGDGPRPNLDWLRERGLEVVCLSTQFRFNQGQEAKEAQEALISAIRLAADLGIGLVNSYSGESDLADTEAAVTRYLERIEPAVKAAEQAGVVLLIENQIDVSPGNACRRASDVLRILRHFDSPSLRHTYDPANYYGAREDPFAAFQDLRPFIAHAHLKDVAKATPQMAHLYPRYKYWPFPDKPMIAVPAGTGEAPLKAAVRLLADSDYDGVACTEPFIDAEPLRQAVRYLHDLGIGG